MTGSPQLLATSAHRLSALRLSRRSTLLALSVRMQLSVGWCRCCIRNASLLVAPAAPITGQPGGDQQLPACQDMQ